MLWSYLIHLSFNMWESHLGDRPGREFRAARPELRCDKPLWDELTQRIADAGGNLLVIDLGDAVRYDSHPEIAVTNAWTPAQLRDELARLRGLGLEPIPKLNFSTGHDYWLKEYERCVSTERYYQVCRDLINEVVELFDKPRFFHLGMDEETYTHQRSYRYVVIRQGELWWHDVEFLIDQVERCGVRPWVWSDALWHMGETYLQRMPRSVLQSNWHYSDVFNKRRYSVNAYLQLEEAGFDQLPTGSNHSHRDNLEKTVVYCRRRIAPERLLGFMQTPWRPTIPEFRDHLLEAADTLRDARAAMPNRRREAKAAQE